MRAFLSHSSKDKHLVEQIAQRLGRARVFYDVYSIDVAEDIEDAIARGIDACDVFVLFASRAALDSKWVQLEMTIAQKRKLLGQLGKVCVFLIEDGVGEKDLPDVLRTVNFRRESSPRIIADDIVRNIQLAISGQRQAFFVGRADETQRAQKALVNTADQAQPNCFVVFGLEGIGRRSFAGQLGRNLFALQNRVDLICRAGDATAEMLLAAEADLGLVGEGRPLQERYNELLAQPEPDRLKALADLIEAATSRGILLSVVDRGGALDEEGQLHKWLDDLRIELSSRPDPKLAVLTTRNPRFDRAADGGDLAAIRVNPMPIDDVITLLKRLFAHHAVQIDNAQARRLAEQVHGYPPAAYFAARMAAEDGIGLLLSDTVSIHRVTETRFLRFLENDKRLTADMKSMLTVLSYYSPLPLAVIADYLGIDAEKMHETTRYLLDNALIYPVGSMYTISEPIQNAVARLFNALSLEHKKVAAAAESFIDETDDSEARFALSRTIYRASTLAGEKLTSSKALTLISDAIDVAIQFYHEQEYEKLIELGEKTLAVQPQARVLREYYVRGLIQLEKFDEAERAIVILERLGGARDAAFLRGFSARKRQRHAEAVTHYKRAVALGRRGVSVHRDLAQCYFNLGDLDQARSEIALAEERDPDNRYVVDLKCQIETSLGNERNAYATLEQLRAVDRDDFYWHRKAVVDRRFGHLSGALDAARQANRVSQRPRFEMRTQLVKCLIENGNLDEAQKELALLDASFKGRRADIRAGLRVKLLTAQGNYKDALTVWDTLKQKDLPIHRALRAQALSKKAIAEPLSAEERAYLDTNPLNSFSARDLLLGDS